MLHTCQERTDGLELSLGYRWYHLTLDPFATLHPAPQQTDVSSMYTQYALISRDIVFWFFFLRRLARFHVSAEGRLVCGLGAVSLKWLHLKPTKGQEET